MKIHEMLPILIIFNFALALQSTADPLDKSLIVMADHEERVKVLRDTVSSVQVMMSEKPKTGSGISAVLPGGASMEFVWIEPGTFLMGSRANDVARYDDETQHRVTLTEGFYLGRYEVTQGQWSAVMGTMPWRGEKYVQSNANHPAVYVSWGDAQSFIGKLNAVVGKRLYRLPTEAEWEYTARAGTTTRWPFGDDQNQLDDYAWYRGNAWIAGKQYGQPVGTKRPNPWGLYDMHGNVWEWCQDWYGEYGTVAQVDPQGPSLSVREHILSGLGNYESVIGAGLFRVIRGGSFSGNGFINRNLRSGNRDLYDPVNRSGDIGFRLLRTE